MAKQPTKDSPGDQTAANSSHESLARGGVSVIIPCYNYGRYLKQAIDSVLAQNFHPLEIIVVNDESTDNTAAMATSYGSRVKYFVQPNKGVSAARNLGRWHATGEFLHFLDADDYTLPGIYEKASEVFQHNPDAVAVYSGCNWVDAGGGLISAMPARPESADVFHDLLVINQWPLASMVVRASVVKSLNGFDETMQASCEDWDLWMRMAATGGRFLPAEGFGACYRQQSAGASGNPKRMLLNGLAVINHYARQHHCAKCKVAAKKGRVEWRQHCLTNKFLPQIEAYLEQGQLGRYLKEWVKIFSYDPRMALQCFWRLRQRKHLVLRGLFGKRP